MIALASDHVGLQLKNEMKILLDDLGIPYQDFGTCNEKRCDYPVFASRAAVAVASGACERGILFCGTGIGISIAANKVNGIRCAVCSDCYSAKLSKEHNNTNMLALGARVVGVDLAKMIIKEWLFAKYEGGRHQRRIDFIHTLESQEQL